MHDEEQFIERMDDVPLLGLLLLFLAEEMMVAVTNGCRAIARLFK